MFVYFVMREFRTQRQQSLYMKAIISFGENFSKKWAMRFRVGGIKITERASRVYQGRVKTTLGYLNLVVTSLILFSKQDKTFPHWPLTWSCFLVHLNLDPLFTIYHWYDLFSYIGSYFPESEQVVAKSADNLPVCVKRWNVHWTMAYLCTSLT